MKRNPTDLADRADKVRHHLVHTCGMSESQARAAVGKGKGEGSDRPALSPAGLEVYGRAVKRIIRSATIEAILLLLPRTGLRINEIVTLTHEQIERRPSGAAVFRVMGKGSKVREVPVSRKAMGILDRYLAKNAGMPRGPGDWVFPAKTGSHISASKVQGAVRALRRVEPDLALLTPHVLRHTFATESMRQCADLKTLRNVLGHNSKRTSLLYYHL